MLGVECLRGARHDDGASGRQIGRRLHLGHQVRLNFLGASCLFFVLFGRRCHRAVDIAAGEIQQNAQHQNDCAGEYPQQGPGETDRLSRPGVSTLDGLDRVLLDLTQLSLQQRDLIGVFSPRSGCLLGIFGPSADRSDSSTGR